MDSKVSFNFKCYRYYLVLQAVIMYGSNGVDTWPLSWIILPQSFILNAIVNQVRTAKLSQMMPFNSANFPIVHNFCRVSDQLFDRVNALPKDNYRIHCL